jgi:hypothetical protein
MNGISAKLEQIDHQLMWSIDHFHSSHFFASKKSGQNSLRFSASTKSAAVSTPDLSGGHDQHKNYQQHLLG